MAPVFKEVNKEFVMEKTYEIFQIADEVDNKRDIIFESLNNLHKRGFSVDSRNYKSVYTGILGEDKDLEDLFEMFNVDHPEDFHGRSMSVSDVIVFTDDHVSKAYYVDSFGFKEVPEFLNGGAEV